MVNTFIKENTPLGDIVFKATVRGKSTKEYLKWNNMFKRVYDPVELERFPNYKGTKICNEWINFQNFARWFNENKWSEDCTFLDKDILVKGNKIYSPETCVLVDNRINCLFTKSDRARGELPIGVYYDKDSKKYKAQCSVDKKRKNLGRFGTVEEAFSTYKTFKESYIKQVADEYFEKYPNFPYKLLQAMYEYKVDIND